MEFVTFEIAKKLKEKGFREKCLLHYTQCGEIFSNSIDTYDRPNQVLDYNDFQRCYNDGNSIGLIDAPTISQVLKWMREEKKMHIIIPASLNERYWWEIRDFNKEISEYSNNEYTSYEKAAIVAIEYTLDNLI